MAQKASVPGWIVECATDIRKLFGVGDEWHIIVSLVDSPAGDEANNGSCSVDATYLNASIELSRSLEGDEEGRRVIMHEMGHIAHGEIDQVVYEALDGLPKRERRRFKRLYNNAVERHLQRMTRAMVRHIAPKDDDG